MSEASLQADAPGVATNGQPPVWKIWRNPIIRRYARSRLRARGLGIWLLLTLMIAGFIFFIARQSGTYRFNLDPVDAARGPLIPLLWMQGLLLFVLATGQVAGAMTAEADEGVLDYQRLAPMRPLAKVIGYLFGLPIREYVLFLATMPFTLWSLWEGEVPLAVAVQLYAVFLVATILYHCTGLVAGTVVKNRRWAFIVSMGAVFVLYTLIPQAAKFGLVYFKYLTIYPVYNELRPYLVPEDIKAFLKVAQNFAPSARFFGLNLPQSVFTILSQAVFIFAALAMVWRRWKRAESHLMGKVGATGLFVWIQVVLLGNALPLVNSGRLFPSYELDRMTLGRFSSGREWAPEGGETELMAGAYGAVTIVMLWLMILMITPSAEGQVRGWRRARKLGLRRLSPFSDPSTAFPWVAIMVAAGATGWFLFTRGLVESDLFPGALFPWSFLGAFLLVMTTSCLGLHALLEGRGGRTVALGAILVGILPVMVGSILAATKDSLIVPAVWLVGISPLIHPFFATATTIPVADLPRDLVRSMPLAFWFWQGVALLVTVRLIRELWRSRRSIAQRTAPVEEEAGTLAEVQSV